LNRHFSGPTIQVGIVSSEPIRLAGLVSAFESHSTIITVQGNLESLLADDSMHYLILDVNDSTRWMETQSTISRLRPDVRQLVLGPSGDDELILRSISAGARGYLDANSRPFAVRMATEAVIEGGIWAPRRLLSMLIDQLLNRRNPSVSLAAPTLSPRERQVLDLIMTSHSNREIAEELGVEERTVKAYVASLMRKTGTDNRVSLSVQATQDSLRDNRVMSS
jgi:DNA-binding NarL/FixJ family response regulator